MQRDELLMLFVDDSNVNVPVAIVTVGIREEEDVRFMNFKAETPPAADFKPPASCNM